jgi:small-conductance mechanosensitive channel
MEEALADLVAQSVEYLPQLLSALVLLVVGLLLGLLLQYVAGALLRSLGVDGFAERSGLDRALKQTSRMDMTLSQLVGRIVFWTVLLFFLASALQAVGLTRAATFMIAVANFLPRILGAVLLVFGGVFAGRVARDLLTDERDRREKLGPWDQLGKITQVMVVTAAILLALILLGMDLAPFVWLLVVTIGAAGVIAAAGWGPILRDRSRDWLTARQLRSQIKNGDLVRIGEVEGFVAKIGETHLSLQTTEGMVYLPYALLATQSLAIITALPESSAGSPGLP